MSDVKVLKPEEFLVREGEASQDMYYLQSGTLAVVKRKGDGMHQIGTIYSGEIVGEMSFLDEEPRSASVKAISECVLTVIPRKKFEQSMKQLPKWYQALVHTLLDRLRKANSRIKV
tara:strand:- start:8289 stop:8636 length:348 start_codon:yes stop_codon:yes gene_type:complete